MLTLALLVLLGAAAWLLLPFWQLSSQFADLAPMLPSRLYGSAERLTVDAPWSVQRLVAHLEHIGYREAGDDRELVPGEFRRAGSTVRVYLRSFPSPEGTDGGYVASVTLGRTAVRALEVNDRAVRSVRLEPPLITSYYGSDLRERRPVKLDELPRELVWAVLAAEDARFFRHQGLSLSGIARAAVVNLRGGEVQQGGSTLTQQLVKNLYLTHDRTWMRKAREAVLASFLELRYEKEQILEAYLNEIYWGRTGSINLSGVGAASFAYFGKVPEQLTLGESATLAGMIQAPNRLSPLRHPEAARTRRDFVLAQMVELGWLEEARALALADQPVLSAPPPIELGFARYAAQAAGDEAKTRFGVENLAGKGYVLLSSLSLEDQLEAEAAVSEGLESLEKNWQRGSDQTLQGALLSADPSDGRILAYVGGRDWGESQFDRVRLARRQAGSAFKPLVYATALARHVVTPIDLLEDSPIEVTQAGKSWRPRNDDGEFRGAVTVRQAIEKSLNVPTVELALRTGLPAIVEQARALGVEGRLQPVPSLALGAFEVTPLELLTSYATFANGGLRPRLHLLDAVLDADGRALEGQAIEAPQRALDPGVAYLVTSLLEGVVERGTGRGAHAAGVRDRLAGKTGTTNQRRDSWFVGYAPERATLVWVGYDEGDPTRLSGSRAALPIWARFTAARRPPGGYATFLPPAEVVSVAIDPFTGQRATGRCPQVVTEYFLPERLPELECELHGGGVDKKRKWWRRIFHRGDRSQAKQRATSGER